MLKEVPLLFYQWDPKAQASRFYSAEAQTVITLQIHKAQSLPLPKQHLILVANWIGCAIWIFKGLESGKFDALRMYLTKVGGGLRIEVRKVTAGLIGIIQLSKGAAISSSG
ncbi:hypothetical protein M422DRAFT_259378 [Sphaerobolus stellatus SS14]|uniref:Uncharacterized protein n=1 Tax=Sphaerobolus stellatus (strain SS14) TaxID=990650 RepID=A0A0C9V8X4_SPHS4|nr:hypothetical protein M422DRAFT_259378 [Sphaerobolus stellatus SS14]